MGPIRAVRVSVMGPRRTASVLRQGMRLSIMLVLVRADRERLEGCFWNMEVFEAYARFFTPDFLVAGGSEILFSRVGVAMYYKGRSQSE